MRFFSRVSVPRTALFLLGCTIASAGWATAQSTDGAFVLLVGADTFAIENFSRRPDGMTGEITGLSLGRILYTAVTTPDGRVPELEFHSWAPGAETGSPPAQTGRVKVEGDSVSMWIGTGDQAQRFAARDDVLLYLNPSFLLTEQIILRARAVGGPAPEVRVFLIQGGAMVPARVMAPSSASPVVSLAGSEFRSEMADDGSLRAAAIPAQGLRIVRVDRHVQPITVLPPDYSAPEGAPYTAEEVTIATAAGHRLAGTLTRPVGRDRVPAVVTITGSGAQDRDEAIPLVRGYRPFREIADSLGRRGIAVLRLDDRGVGGSSGDVASATLAELADDIGAAVAFLRERPDIDGERVVLVGHSEGALVAPMVAAADARLRGIVLIAGPSRTGREVLQYQVAYTLGNSPTVPTAARDSAERAAMERLERQAAAVPSLRAFLEYDPQPTARRVARTPVLILQGETDRQVTADQALELAESFRAAGNSDVTVRLYPGINHLLLPDPDGNPAGYARLEENSVDRGVLGELVEWTVARVR